MKRGASELERQVQKRLWDLGGGTVHQVLEGWSEGPRPGYTSVLKVLQILETKGKVAHERAGRSYRYHALIQRAEATKGRFRELLHGFFGGDRLGLVNSLIDEMDLSPREIADLRRLLAARAREEDTK
jgi:BlaI family penicillinase repressor